MDRTERFYKIQQLLVSRRGVPRDVFLDKLGISHATFKRDLEYLRERLMMPIIWDREAGGYRLDDSDPSHGSYRLPGLWYSADELHALLAMEQLLRRLEGGLLGPQVEPLRARVGKLIEAGDHSLEEFKRRIRLVGTRAVAVDAQLFQTLITALLHRRRLAIELHDRAAETALPYQVSPQRLVHFREHWYLDAWCHGPFELRSLPLDTIASARLVDKRAREITDRTLDAELGAGYGIFAGSRTETAVLKFAPHRARWVARERWHPEQSGSYELDGGYVLQVPFSDPRELLADVLSHGADVEVLAPPSLRLAVEEQLKRSAAKYSQRRRRQRRR
ncbi:MAG TPA: WYL domain-containing protein [Gammaproteobacteria bacterium]|nr:WYL domain-containing protein [Gammaproteobacteria bacterium]